MFAAALSTVIYSLIIIIVISKCLDGAGVKIITLPAVQGSTYSYKMYYR